MLQYCAVHYIIVEHIKIYCSILQYSTVHYNTVQCVTIHCIKLQYSTICYSTVQYVTILDHDLTSFELQERGLNNSLSLSVCLWVTFLGPFSTGFIQGIKWAIMDGFWILRCLKKRFDVLILNTISKFSKTKN